VCAKQEEARAALECLRSPAAAGVLRSPEPPQTVKVKAFSVVRFTLASGHSAALVAGVRQGPQSAGVFTSTALLELRPLTAVMVGICAATQPIKVRARSLPPSMPELSRALAVGAFVRALPLLQAPAANGAPAVFSSKPAPTLVMATSAFNVTEGKQTPKGFLPDYKPRSIAPAADAALSAVAAQFGLDPAVFITTSAVQEVAQEVFQSAMEKVNRHCCALDMEVRGGGAGGRRPSAHAVRMQVCGSDGVFAPRYLTMMSVPLEYPPTHGV
jgi:hypothetical protein